MKSKTNVIVFAGFLLIVVNIVSEFSLRYRKLGTNDLVVSSTSKQTSTLFQNVTKTRPLFLEESPPSSQRPPIIVGESELKSCVAFFANDRQHHDQQKLEPASLFSGYRLGDCIKGCRTCGNDTDTIAFAYSQAACPSSLNNLKVIKELLHQKDGKEGFEVPDPNAVVIHLRLGDVMERVSISATTMLMDGATPRHNGKFPGAIRSIYQYLDDLQETGATKVEIVGGSHHAYTGQTKSLPYAHCLHYALHMAGYQTSLRLGGVSPDQDFYYMSHSKRIMVSSGGFSRLMGQMAVEHGGEIIGKSFRRRR